MDTSCVDPGWMGSTISNHDAKSIEHAYKGIEHAYKRYFPAIMYPEWFMPPIKKL